MEMINAHGNLRNRLESNGFLFLQETYSVSSDKNVKIRAK